MSKVSICIPTYNGARYLEACLDSVLSQTYRDIEILVVDDGSTDSTFEILEHYAASDQRIRLRRNNNNLGLVGNWNRCIELARGEWIKFAFQDDLLAPTCLEKMFGAMQDEVPILFCRREFIFDENVDPTTRDTYEKLRSIDALFPGQKQLSADEVSRIALSIDIQSNFIGEPTCALIHRSAFERFGLFNPQLIQMCDYEYWLRVGSNTGFVYVPETLAYFRVHSNSMSIRNRDGRSFRYDYLDMLVMLKSFAYDPSYSKLRAVARKLDPPRRLKKELAEKAYWLCSHATDAAKRTDDPDPSLLEEWDSLAGKFPEITKSPYLWLHRFRGWWARQVSWRFRT